MQLVENAVVAGRFRLNRLLGKGGMGSVWHATHLGLDVPCAVKFMEGEIARMAEGQARFEREAKAAAQLRSPHVVQILDHGVCDGTPYIAMELLDGEDLGKRLARLGKLPTAELNTVITQVCRALTKAHTVSIVHRDLKPDNIFLVRDDDREIAKVLDFGIAKNNAVAEGSHSQTRTGALLGTPYYVSPEQAQGTKTVDSRSDLWSLAIIVYQCLVGRLPFESEALGDLLVKIIVSPIPVPSHFGPVPPQFDAWWAKAAARDPALRFQSAKEFADSLSVVLGSSYVTEVMDRPPELVAALAARQPQAPNVSTPGLSAHAQSVVAPSNVTPNPEVAPFARTAMEESGVPKKRGAGAIIAVAAIAVVAIVAVVIVMMRSGRSTQEAQAVPTADVSHAAAATTAIPTAVATVSAALALPEIHSAPPEPSALTAPKATAAVVTTNTSAGAGAGSHRAISAGSEASKPSGKSATPTAATAKNAVTNEPQLGF